MAGIFRQSIPQSEPPRSPREILLTMYDLPSENPEEPGLPDEFHNLQPQLLSRTLRLTNYTRDNYFTASDLSLYYDIKHPLWHERPDWFLVVDVPRLYDEQDLRSSYVIWQEGESPAVVVEFLSPGTEREDLGPFYAKAAPRFDCEPTLTLDEADEPESALPIPPGRPNGSSSDLTNGKKRQRATPPGKFEMYERYLRIPHYIVYSRYTQQLHYFKLCGGCYQEQLLSSHNPRLWLADLQIGLGVWSGEFEGIRSHWLRGCDREGNWSLTDTEQAEQEKRQAEQEKERAEAKLRQAAQNLLANGMAMTQVAEILGLSVAEITAFDQNL